MPIVRADRWLDEHTAFTLGGVDFEIDHLGPAHSPEDVIVVLPKEGVIFGGDILFAGRIPFVGAADSRQWLVRIDRLLELKPRIIVTGHGEASRDPARDLALTRDYLVFLRKVMGKAVEYFVPFDEAYAKVDWGRFAKVPAFDAANRLNATERTCSWSASCALITFGKLVESRVEISADVSPRQEELQVEFRCCRATCA